MDKRLTKEDIINTAKCCIADSCVSCPRIDKSNCITDFMKHVLEYMENEPAPAATGTSSEISKDTSSTHLNNSTLIDVCQAALANISEGYGDNYSSGYAQATLDALKQLKGEQSD